MGVRVPSATPVAPAASSLAPPSVAAPALSANSALAAPARGYHGRCHHDDHEQ